MLRRCRLRLNGENWSAWKNPNVTRHAQSTFHEGVHREPPRPARAPWMDPIGPWSFLRTMGVDGWVLNNPKAQLFLVGTLLAVSYYAFCLSFDIKAHYLMNNNMHRELHLQRAKSEELLQRCTQLEEALTMTTQPADGDGKLSAEKKSSSTDSSSASASATGDGKHTDANPDGRYEATNYEFELGRERTRSKELHRQHQVLVHELADVRSENMRLKKQVAALTVETESLQKLVAKFHRQTDEN